MAEATVAAAQVRARWFGLLAPAGTAAPVVDLLQKTVAKAIAQDLQKWEKVLKTNKLN